MVAEIQGLFVSLKTETELRRSAELKQLQAQINPHFLYNSLFFIMSVAQFSPDAVMRMSKHLAEYYRYLTKLDQHEVTLESELICGTLSHHHDAQQKDRVQHRCTPGTGLHPPNASHDSARRGERHSTWNRRTAGSPSGNHRYQTGGSSHSNQSVG